MTALKVYKNISTNNTELQIHF